jgi:cobalt-zinc-cadmium efflux system outer membrane protein
MKTPPGSIAALSGLAVVLAGCQSYEPEPLDLAAHREGWLARAPGDEPVRAFADRLAVSGRPTSFDPADGLSLDEGEIVALVFNPDLRLARLRAGVAAASAEHAGLWEDPQFSIDVLRVIENVSSPWVIMPGLGFTIPISGRLEAEQARADAVLAAELSRVAEREWGVRVEVRREWLRWSAARLGAERTERLLTSIESLVASTGRLADAGEMPRPEAALFGIEEASQRLALARFRGEAARSEQRLRSLLGLSPEAPVELIPTVVLGDEPEALAADALADRNPTLARLRNEYEIAEAMLWREVRKQYPDLTIGPLYESDQGQSRIGFLGSIPLPILNANKRGIAEARAERELARAAFETEYERLAGSLAATRAELAARREQREIIESEMVPLVDRQLGDARRLLELGEGGGLVLLESLTRASQIQIGLIDARLGESLAVADLAELVGPLAPPTDPSHPNPQPDDPDAAAPADEVNP